MAKRAEKRNSLFLQIIGNGKMGAYCENPTENSEPYTDTKGKTKHYEFYESITGKIQKVYVYDKEMANDLTFEMLCINIKNAQGESEVLTMPFKSKYAQSLIVRLEGINLVNEVTIKSFKIKDAEKSKANGSDVFNQLCLAYQGLDEKGKLKSIQNDYKKDGTKKLVQAVQTDKKVKGKIVTTWDFSGVEENLRDIVKGVDAKVKELNAPIEPAQAIDNLEVVTEGEDNDNLPF